MTEQDDNREIVRRPQPMPPVIRGQPVRTIQLGPQDVLDVSNLPVREQDALEAKNIELAIERGDRAQRIQQDLGAMAGKVRIMTTAVKDATDQGAAATASNTTDDGLGRTEFLLGNSDDARKGKLSRSQQGLGDNTKLWILLALIAGVVIVLVAALKH